MAEVHEASIDTILYDVAALPCSQPAPAAPSRRRGRAKTLEGDAPAAKSAKLIIISRLQTIASGSMPKSASQSDLQNLMASPQCSNKQILEAITKLSGEITTRIDHVEQSLTLRMKALESTLEAKLRTSLCAEVKTKVDDAVKDIRTEVDAKLRSPLSQVENLKAETASVKQDIQHLKDENEYVTDMLLQHQKYLESCEATKRASNIIITGVPETDMHVDDAVYSSDENKVRCVLDGIHQEAVEFQECSRLGQAATTHARPLKVKLRNSQDRPTILANSKHLKNKNPPLNKVYVKKDVHPMVRKEFARLRRVEKEEKDKPENQGRSVKYDAETRCVLIDGIIIDKFRPAFL